MAISIDLHNKPMGGAVEVGNVVTQRFLAGEFRWEVAEEIEPKPLLGWRQGPAQDARVRDELAAIRQVRTTHGHNDKTRRRCVRVQNLKTNPPLACGSRPPSQGART